MKSPALINRHLIVFTLLVVFTLGGCIDQASEPEEVQPSLPSAQEALVSTPFSHTLLLHVPANETAVVQIRLTEEALEGMGYLFLGVSAQGEGDASVGIAVSLRRGSEARTSYHPFAVPGDGSGWAMRAFGGIAGDPNWATPHEVLLFLGAKTDTTFRFGAIHPDDYGLRYRAPETLATRPVQEVASDGWTEPFVTGTHWSIQDAQGLQEWRAGDLELDITPSETGDETAWHLPFHGPVTLEAIYWRPAGVVTWEAQVGPVQESGVNGYTTTPVDLPLAVVSGLVPGLGYPDFQISCFDCGPGTAEGHFSFTGTNQHANPVVATVVTGGGLPPLDWAGFGWPDPSEWMSIREGNNGGHLHGSLRA